MSADFFYLIFKFKEKDRKRKGSKGQDRRRSIRTSTQKYVVPGDNLNYELKKF